MNMETKQDDKGLTRVYWTAFERWLAAGVGTGILAFAYWLISSVSVLITTTQLTSQQVNTVQTQVNQLSTQMQDLSALKLKVAEQGVQIEQNKQDIRELKSLRAVK